MGDMPDKSGACQWSSRKAVPNTYSGAVGMERLAVPENNLSNLSVERQASTSSVLQGGASREWIPPKRSLVETLIYLLFQAIKLH